MDVDTTTNGLAHELWAMAQEAGSIEDAVTPMMAELLEFAQSVRAAERERCAKLIETYPEWIGPNAAREIAYAIRKA